jgi:hypothetical protein
VRSAREVLERADVFYRRARVCAVALDVVSVGIPLLLIGAAFVLWLNFALAIGAVALACGLFALRNLAMHYGRLWHVTARMGVYIATGDDPCAPEAACGQLPVRAVELRREFLEASISRERRVRP